MKNKTIKKTYKLCFNNNYLTVTLFTLKKIKFPNPQNFLLWNVLYLKCNKKCCNLEFWIPKENLENNLTLIFKEKII